MTHFMIEIKFPYKLGTDVIALGYNCFQNQTLTLPQKLEQNEIDRCSRVKYFMSEAGKLTQQYTHKVSDVADLVQGIVSDTGQYGMVWY